MLEMQRAAEAQEWGQDSADDVSIGNSLENPVGDDDGLDGEVRGAGVLRVTAAPQPAACARPPRWQSVAPGTPGTPPPPRPFPPPQGMFGGHGAGGPGDMGWLFGDPPEDGAEIDLMSDEDDYSDSSNADYSTATSSSSEGGSGSEGGTPSGGQGGGSGSGVEQRRGKK